MNLPTLFEIKDLIERILGIDVFLDRGPKETLYRLTLAAEYRDGDTGSHIKRIGCYSRILAVSLGLSKKEVAALVYGSLTHDIGKIGIPDHILLKPGRLTLEECKIMKTHTTIGAMILTDSESEILNVAEAIALNHHERWDGTGYPNGLKGADIPLEDQIVHIVDQYDALRSKRPYKPALDHWTAYKIITEGDGRTMPHHFSLDVLAAFRRCALELEDVFLKVSTSG